MSDAESDAADVHSQRDDQIDLTDQDSQSVGKKRKAGRPVTDAWATFRKVANPNPGKSKRNWIGICQFCDCKVSSGKVEDLRAHAANCKKATPDAQLAARVQQVRAGGGGGTTSSQTSLNSYADIGKDKLTKEQNKVLQRLLTLAFIMCGIPFACVGNSHMLHALRCLKPSLFLLVRLMSFTNCVHFCISHIQHSQYMLCCRHHYYERVGAGWSVQRSSDTAW